jgi:Fic family protein
MSYISRRFVKNIKYYYLEESFLHNGRLLKPSIYLGPISPSNEVLLKAFDELKKKCAKFNHPILTPPLTEYISNRTAKILDELRKKKLKEQKLIPLKQRLDSLHKERVEHLKAYLLESEKRGEFKFEKCIFKYEELLNSISPISKESIIALHDSIYSSKKNFSGYRAVELPSVEPFKFPPPNEIESLMNILHEWVSEKSNLIHPIEFAAKFHAKFSSISPFSQGNYFPALLISNLILEKKGFSFFNPLFKNKDEYLAALSAGFKENHKPLTKLFIKEQESNTN